MSIAPPIEQVLAESDGVHSALSNKALASRVDVSVSEALVLGLLNQGVKKFFVILGHGNTDLGEVLRRYSSVGLISVASFRNEIEMTHAATALRWSTAEPVAVVTSIGPGALQALSASLTDSSNGVGVWHIYGDETTLDEGPNMQQLPGIGQGQFLKLASQMGHTYQLHTPEAVTECLRRGSVVTNHPSRPQPFFVLLPINVQPTIIPSFNLERLPKKPSLLVSLAPENQLVEAADALGEAKRVVIKVGRGARKCGQSIMALAEELNAVVVTSPSSLGIVPSSHPRVMGVGGSKGSIAGNYAMENADALVVIGSRAVCQSDCSRTGYPSVQRVVNINADVFDATHYNNTFSVVGDVGGALDGLTSQLKSSTRSRDDAWLSECQKRRAQWREFVAERVNAVRLFDPSWNQEVLNQPSAIKLALDWATKNSFRVFFDAGDVQANGFQLCETDSEDWFYTDSGASYMGFASSAILAGGLANEPFYSVAIVGDGSFVMNPQSLIDAVHLGVKGAIVILDNRRMAAISSLQEAQYAQDFATADHVAIDYVAWANSVSGVQGLWGGTSASELTEALSAAETFDGLSVLHVPVYFGSDDRGGLGAYGRWNVGSWVAETQGMFLAGRL